jgi:hypothetical protein
MPTVLMNKQSSPKYQNIFQNQYKQTKNGIAHGGVRQDKTGGVSDRSASGEPASDAGASDRGPSETKSHRSKSGFAPSRAKVPMTFHIDPILKADIQRRAQLNGNSASAEGEAMLEAKAREDLHKQQAQSLEATMERIHAKVNRRLAKRLAFFLTSILFDVGETKVLMTNLLGMRKGMTEDMLKDILSDADKQTRHRLLRKYPELTEFTQAIEEWLLTDEDAGTRGTNGHRGRGGHRV